MLSIISLIKKLETDFPQFKFEESTVCSWSSNDSTIYYNLGGNKNSEFILHELAHGLLGHAGYTHDIELLSMERDAWDEAIQLALKYDTLINDATVQSSLDTYRDWLHARSTCPKCQAVGLQIHKHTYQCVACNNKWRVNEAKTCALRRHNNEQ